VAAIFEEFGRVQPVEVVRLLGPGEATRVAVLDQLINYRFDVLHYAGHCFFNSDDPPSSGWLFNRDPQQVLTAHELSRIDRIPRFVFSNACESGITPDRASERNALVAPSFAEAFFARGVANFIGTAWPVNDGAALGFARRLYRGLLGLHESDTSAESMHQAMTAARLEIAALGVGGMQTWGAYQHYGDPNFRILPAPAMTPRAPRKPGKKPRRRSEAGTKS
jgi:CHAT domain-containing protein